MAVNTALKLAIFTSGKPQKVIATRAGLHASQLSKIVRGHRPANRQERESLARVLRRREEELFPLAS